MTSTSFILTEETRARMTLPIASRDPNTNSLTTTLPDSSLFARLNSPEYDNPTFQMGAWGLRGSFADYAKLLQHLLQLDPASNTKSAVAPILDEQSWKTLFVGFLTDSAKKGLTFARGYRIPEPEVNWSSGGLMVNEVNWKGRRKAGSGAWQGLAHTYSMLDPKTGLAVSSPRERRRRREGEGAEAIRARVDFLPFYVWLSTPAPWRDPAPPRKRLGLRALDTVRERDV